MSSTIGSRILICSVVLGLLMACATASPKLVSGYVSDAACGARHAGHGGADCIRKCIRGGASVGHPEWAPQAMVLVQDGDRGLVVVENPEMLAGHEGEHVVVEARLRHQRLRITRLMQ